MRYFFAWSGTLTTGAISALAGEVLQVKGAGAGAVADAPGGRQRSSFGPLLRRHRAAVGMTQRVGNPAMTRILQNALDELNKTGTISVGTRKTVALGGRTKTVKTGATVPMEGLPSNDEIRKLTGA